MKLLAIDGNSIMNRAFYGIKALSNKKGVFTNALTGFMNIYLKTVGDTAKSVIENLGLFLIFKGIHWQYLPYEYF